MNCDASYSALPALAVLGAAIGGSHVASPKKRWKEPPYIWALPIGKSGAIKSPPYRDVEDLAEDINDRLEAEYRDAFAVYEAEIEDWEAARKEARKGGPDPGPKPKPPVKKAFIKSTRQTFAELLDSLYQLPSGTWASGRPAPHLVRLSDDAKARFIAFYNANGAALETADEDMSAVMSKLEGYALRFALIFHCCRLKEYAKDARITAEDMDAAIQLTTWFRDEAERVYLVLVEPPEIQAARHLAEVVRKLADRDGGRAASRSTRRCRRPTGPAR